MRRLRSTGEEPLCVRIRPSVRLRALLALAHLGAAACLLVVVTPAVWRIALLGGLVVSLLRGWRQLSLRAPEAVHALYLDAGGEVHVATRTGRWLRATAVEPRVVGPTLIVAHLVLEEAGPCLLVIPADAADVDALRRLRRRWMRPTRAQGARV